MATNAPQLHGWRFGLNPAAAGSTVRSFTRLDLPRRFGVSPPQAPAVQLWGLRVLYLTDPTGILWHIAQR